MIGVGSLVSLCVVAEDWNVLYVDLVVYGLFDDVSVMRTYSTHNVCTYSTNNMRT